MNRLGSKFAWVLAASAAATVAAQPPGGGRGFGRGMGGGGVSFAYVTLLENADVQKELAFTADEKAGVPLIKEELKKIDEALIKEMEGLRGGDRMEAMRAGAEKTAAKRKDAQKLIAEGLGEEKFKRFMQIYYQMVGVASFGRMVDADVAAKLGVTDEQREQLRELQRDVMQNAGIDFRKMRDATEEERADMFKKMADSQKEVDARVFKEVLTDSQRKYIEELRGKPVSFKVSLQPQFGGRGGPGGPGGAGGGRRPRGDKGGEKGGDKEGKKEPPAFVR